MKLRRAHSHVNTDKDTRKSVSLTSDDPCHSLWAPDTDGGVHVVRRLWLNRRVMWANKLPVKHSNMAVSLHSAFSSRPFAVVTVCRNQESRGCKCCSWFKLKVYVVMARGWETSFILQASLRSNKSILGILRPQLHHCSMPGVVLKVKSN